MSVKSEVETRAQVLPQDIVLSVDVETTPDKVYEALTTQQGLAGWYTPETKAEPKVGTVIEFKFADLTTLKFRVEALEPGRSVTWSGVQVPGDWEGTRIRFDITPQSDMVNLQFTQTGLPPAYRDFGVFSYLWGQYLRSLKTLVETGKGEPFGSTASRLAGTTPRMA